MKQFALLLAMLCTVSLYAQRDNTLFNRSHRAGLFITPILTEVSEFNGDRGTSVGGGVGLVAGNLFIGAYGLGQTDYEQLIFNDEINEVKLAHGGFWFGYVPFQHKALHPYSSVRLGWGAVNITEDNIDDEILDGVFVTTPEIGLELNIFRWLRLSGAVGYRWVDGIETATIPSQSYNNWTGTVNLRIGWFGHTHRHHHHDKKERERKEKSGNG